MMQGNTLRDAFLSAANNIYNNRQKVDALNVFPVPDGDTGTNMSMTMAASVRELERLGNPTVADVTKVASSALLRGARGNSGVILSLLFRGFAKGFAGKREADGKDLAKALALGVEAAYKAVMKPTEGTILTVARVAAERALEVADADDNPVFVFDEILKAARQALEETPEMLPVLKQAGVVDAGGKGLVVIFEGMQSAIRDNVMVEKLDKQPEPASDTLYADRNAAGEYEGEITFTYCTEFIIDKGESANPDTLRSYLESIGDCVVVVDDETIIKAHVHTDNPGNALQEALKSGSLSNVKIENMRNQHADNRAAAQRQSEGAGEVKFPYQPVDPSNAYGFVAVAAGDGMQKLFQELGVANVVSGGQTMNPSTDDILQAVQATPAKTVIVLPNNKNIIMAAEQTIHLADRTVCVLPTRTIPQGISALLAIDPEADTEANMLNMTRAANKVETGLVTFAARDSEFDGHKIREGEILALENGKLSFTGRDLDKSCVKLTRQLLRKDSSFVTVYYGSGVTDEKASEVEAAIREKLPDTVELTLIDGGQPVYYFIISVE